MEGEWKINIERKLQRNWGKTRVNRVARLDSTFPQYPMLSVNIEYSANPQLTTSTDNAQEDVPSIFHFPNEHGILNEPPADTGRRASRDIV